MSAFGSVLIWKTLSEIAASQRSQNSVMLNPTLESSSFFSSPSVFVYLNVQHPEQRKLGLMELRAI